MKGFLKLSFFCLLIVGACDEGSDGLNYESLEATTGLQWVDANGNLVGKWKIPNDYNPSSAIYPNPSNGIISISALEPLKRFWIVPATCVNENNSQIPNLISSVSYSVEDIEARSVKDFVIQSNNLNVVGDLSDLSSGIYKVFIELDNGTINWFSIYIDPQQNNFPDLEFLDLVCN